jgi:hypothetical protein
MSAAPTGDVMCFVAAARDEQEPRIRRHVDHEHMADAPGRAQTRGTRNHGAHQLVGMQTAFHQRVDPSGSRQLDGFIGRRVTVLGRNDFVRRKIDLFACRHRANLLFRSDQHRNDHLAPRGFECAVQRIDRMDARRRSGLAAALRIGGRWRRTHRCAAGQSGALRRSSKRSTSTAR